jgi:hypothetical protein
MAMRRRWLRMKSDEKGFSCECGLRNDYPGYVKDHWGVKLVYSCSCKRRYVLLHGTVTLIPVEPPEYFESEAFGD